MTSSLQNLVDNISEGIHKIECTNSNRCCLICKSFKDSLIEFKYFCCNKNCQKTFHEKLKKRFVNTYTFANHDINKLIVLLQKDVYPYEYMDDRKWKFFQSLKHGRYYWCRL